MDKLKVVFSKRPVLPFVPHKPEEGQIFGLHTPQNSEEIWLGLEIILTKFHECTEERFIPQTTSSSERLSFLKLRGYYRLSQVLYFYFTNVFHLLLVIISCGKHPNMQR